MNIHSIPIQGRLAERFKKGVIQKVEMVAPISEWNGIYSIYSCDEELSLSEENPNIAGGSYVTDDKGGTFTFTHNDGSKETFQLYPNTPVILMESGLLKSEYWFAFTLLHELGHHNDPNRPMKPTYNGEIFAHLFAFDRLCGHQDKFHRLDETPPYLYYEALQIHQAQCPDCRLK
ncbi:hypothetical protein HP398_05250 [Brevibacillus sp. HB1.4B]|uniref:ImmA/IrrE family metallo-endopeptidase n=1 Tax=Brevibacillus sp. HB1.4B TaxID=2738845 RepID=UPI00156BB51A|nr:hypothetical protein [Brevibacillus sp. HB1.4B]NRS15839.1 hypothetical protein [Brevibacillus sp. HB1.4B]